MYLTGGHGYYAADGSQHARRGRFLLLIQPEHDTGTEPIKVLVRKVALSQCGNWMMGSAHAYGHRIGVSGSYGGDGLPCSVPAEVYDRATVVLPDDLRAAWNTGGGWNSAGSEASAMRRWALANIDRLTV